MIRILLIDDDEAVRKATAILLRAQGFDPVTAEGGKAGVAAIEAGAFDLVIVDLFMPGMDGMETIKAIRQRNSNIPIIAVSGFMFSGDCPEMPNFGSMMAEAGAISTLYKPFRPAELMQAIRGAIPQAA
jgi:CheY-like chemotaxis protein